MIIRSNCLIKIIMILIYTIDLIKCKQYPLIFMSGYMGNQLNVRLKDAEPPFGCLKNSFIRVPLWLDAVSAYLFPECWQYKMELHYDKKLHKSFSNKGVDIDTNQFGTTMGVDYIASQFPFPQQNRISSYFEGLIRSLELHAGYKRNYNIFGAMYDWRKSPHEQPEFFRKLKQLCELAFYMNNKTPVILIGHSMGGNEAYLFLRMQPQHWKKKYIRSAIYMAVPFGGNLKYLYSYMYNDDFAGNILPMFREIERGYSSLAFLLPNRRIFHDDVLLETPHSKYTAYNLDKLMIRLGRPEVIPMWRDTRNILDPLVHPGTDTVCVLGIGFNTIRKIILTKDALIDGKYRKHLKKRSTIDNLNEFNEIDFLKLKNNNLTRIELLELFSNRTSFLKENLTRNDNLLTNLDGKARDKKQTQNLINKIKGKFNTIFRTTMNSFLNLGDQLSRKFPFSISRSIRDNIFNSKRFYYYMHSIRSWLLPELPRNAFDLKNGRYIFFSEGDGFVNIESGLGCLNWYSDSPKSKFEFYFDVINDNHLGMLRNKPSIKYFTKLILAIK